MTSPKPLPEGTPRTDKFRKTAAELGAEFLEKLKKHDPDYCWSQTPTEWIVDQINKYDDLKATCEARALEAAAKVVLRYLSFDSQRAVSWHEVNDAVDAIRALSVSRTHPTTE